MKVTNFRNPGRTQNLGYDSLNRVASAVSQATTGPNCWGQTVPPGGYDRYGNLTAINSSQCATPGLSLTVNANNQITNPGFSYDAAGNMLQDGTGVGAHSYTWDAEGRLTATAGVTYTYDGDGKRVKNSGGTLYWTGPDGAVLAESNLAGTITNEYIYFYGARIARRDSLGNVYYAFADQVGSTRSITNAAGTLCYDADFYPFGGELNFTSTCAQNYKFAGTERDAETGNDHTWFRYFRSNLGRWLSPDPLAGEVANPQSLNRYAYVMNNPTSLVDPLGLEETCGQGITVPPGESAATYCYNQLGIGVGSANTSGGCNLDSLIAGGAYVASCAMYAIR